MSHKERQNLISLFTLVIVSVPYLIYIIARHNTESFAGVGDEISFWTVAIVAMIPVRIVIEIIAHIAMTIVTAILTGKSKINNRTDERDYLISLKSNRNAHYTFAVSMIVALSLSAASGTLATLFVLILIGGMATELVEIASKFFYYGRGH